MTGALAGKRILVIEDEYFIASDLKRGFEKQGAVVIGPVADVGRGLALASGEIDVAVLDVNLEGATSYPIVDRLSQRGIPCVFLTGYNECALLEAFRGVPRIVKPFSMKTVLDQVRRLASAPVAR